MDNILGYELSDGGSIPSGRTILQEIDMQKMLFVNPINKEQWVCDDIQKGNRQIDGVTYLQVHKPDSFRKVLMRKDSLQKVDKFKK